MKLNLGCGNNRREGYINIDKIHGPRTVADVYFDLESTPWALPTSDGSYGAIPINQYIGEGSVTEILAHHVLEHLGAEPGVFINVMKEMYRVLVPGGTIEIKVPHPRSDGFLGDPTHVRAITPQMLQLFSKAHCCETLDKGWPNTPLALHHDVDLELVSTEYRLMPHWGRQQAETKMSREALDFAIASYYNVIDEIVIVLRKVE